VFFLILLLFYRKFIYREKIAARFLLISVHPRIILWKNTKKIGIGYATFGHHCVVVAIYDPYNINQKAHNR